MDLVKIGKFISEQRKDKGLSQVELADRLNLSNKTISKWERGNGFPDVSLLLPLCEELDISVNELLSGQKLEAMEYHERAEENLIKVISKARVSPQEKMIRCTLSVALLVFAVTVMVMSYMDFFRKSNEAMAAIGVLAAVSFICIGAVWITTTLVLKDFK